MTREQRTEAAARAICLCDGLNPDAGIEGERLWMRYAKDGKAALTAAFPELMSDPPTAELVYRMSEEQLLAELDRIGSGGDAHLASKGERG